MPEKLCDEMTKESPNYSEQLAGVMWKKEADLKKDRNSKVKWYPLDHWIVPKLCEIASKINNEEYMFDVTNLQCPQFTEYKKGQHYTWHTDGPGCCHNSARKSSVLHKSDALHYTQQTNLLGTVRKISISAILNDDYKGGELQFRTLSPTGQLEESSVACKTGDIIVFPSYLHHRVKPITKGVRYSIVAWYGGPPFK